MFIGFRDGVLEQFGDAGLQQIGARLSEDARVETFDNALIREWLPREYFDEWFHAVWEGPAGADQAAYERFLAAMVEHGVHRFFRSLFRFLTPARFADAVVKQYKRDHTGGRLRASVSGKTMQIKLYDLPFDPSPFNLMSTARSFHHGIALLELPELTSDYRVAEDGSLAMSFRWA